MIIHSNPLFTIYFGNAQDALSQDYYYNLSPEHELLEDPLFMHLRATMGLESLIFLKQIHNDTGYVVTPETCHDFKRPFFYEGDYLLTDLLGIGIGIMTADCLPIIMHDTRSNAIAAIHAGWRGSVKRIAQKAFAHMQKVYGTDGTDIRVFFGPSAQSCCYKVGDTVTAYTETDPLLAEALIEHADGLYLNVARYNMLQLIEVGIPQLAFHTSYNMCTICDERLCSYRRDNKSPYRQMTVVALR